MLWNRTLGTSGGCLPWHSTIMCTVNIISSDRWRCKRESSVKPKKTMCCTLYSLWHSSQPDAPNSSFKYPSTDIDLALRWRHLLDICYYLILFDIIIACIFKSTRSTTELTIRRIDNLIINNENVTDQFYTQISQRNHWL